MLIHSASQLLTLTGGSQRGPGLGSGYSIVSPEAIAVVAVAFGTGLIAGRVI